MIVGSISLKGSFVIDSTVRQYWMKHVAVVMGNVCPRTLHSFSQPLRSSWRPKSSFGAQLQSANDGNELFSVMTWERRRKIPLESVRERWNVQWTDYEAFAHSKRSLLKVVQSSAIVVRRIFHSLRRIACWLTRKLRIHVPLHCSSEKHFAFCLLTVYRSIVKR